MKIINVGELACLKCGHLLKFHTAFETRTLTGHGCASFAEPDVCTCAVPEPGWAGLECGRCGRPGADRLGLVA